MGLFDSNNQKQGDPTPESEKLAQLKSAQTLATIGIIAGPVSMLFGGVLLSSIALICAIVAIMKAKKVLTPHDENSSVARAIYRQTIVALAVSALALALNAVSLAMILPSIMDAVQTGDLDQILNMYGLSEEAISDGNAEGSSGSSSSSIWG